MAPREPANPEPAKNLKTANDTVTKPEVRLAPEGLLDVEWESGNHKNRIEANADSPLMRLPGEIRMKIWEYTLGGEPFLIMENWWRLNTVKVSEQRQLWLSLLRTCRQVYKEASLLPYQLNTFKTNAKFLYFWARALKSVQRGAIWNLELITYPIKGRLPSGYDIKDIQYNLVSSVKCVTIFAHDWCGVVGHHYTQTDDIPKEDEEEILELFGTAPVYFKRSHWTESLTTRRSNWTFEIISSITCCHSPGTEGATITLLLRTNVYFMQRWLTLLSTCAPSCTSTLPWNDISEAALEASLEKPWGFAFQG